MSPCVVDRHRSFPTLGCVSLDGHQSGCLRLFARHIAGRPSRFCLFWWAAGMSRCSRYVPLPMLARPMDIRGDVGGNATTQGWLPVPVLVWRSLIRDAGGIFLPCSCIANAMRTSIVPRRNCVGMGSTRVSSASIATHVDTLTELLASVCFSTQHTLGGGYLELHRRGQTNTRGSLR